MPENLPSGSDMRFAIRPVAFPWMSVAVPPAKYPNGRDRTEDVIAVPKPNAWLIIAVRFILSS